MVFYICERALKQYLHKYCFKYYSAPLFSIGYFFYFRFYFNPFITTVLYEQPIVFAIYLFSLIIFLMFLLRPFTLQIVFPFFVDQ